jgi:beta-galactosidase/beta-glucuronidase
MHLPRQEYPRPQFVRDSWMSLNGEWEFQYDDNNAGERENWFSANKDTSFDKRIQVPFCPQSKLSGIGDTDFHDTVWYRKEFEVPQQFANKRVIVHFGAVDYLSWVWVNGQLVATHEGGHTPFQADITNVLKPSGNTIVVKAQDFSKDVTLPRGKQFWEEKSRSIFYTRTTGIWQSVWLEAVNPTYLSKVQMTPDIDKNEIQLRIYLNGRQSTQNLRMKVNVTFKGEPVTEDTFQVTGDIVKRTIGLDDFNDHGLGRWWSPNKPNLYDIQFTLLDGGAEADTVSSYFGMRKISIEFGKLCLNNRPLFHRQVLDQGYFPDGILTAPTDDALRLDVELTKQMGFNGARKHQKLEDPRWLYWCDKLGLLVWSEAANAYQFSDEYVRRFSQEWQESMDRDYNHPSIVAWVPINESWGVPNILIDEKQQHHAMAMYYLTKSLDTSRPVVSNDGWEHMKTDLLTIHDYEWREEVLAERYSTADKAVGALPANRKITVGGTEYENQPILVSEFGGISFKKSEWEGWGYSGASSDEDFISRLKAVVSPLHRSPVVQGFCYTQLTDVEQEINGLLTYNREPKVPLDIIRDIIIGKNK